MNQEVQVVLVMSVDVSQNKKEIESFINSLINTHTFHSSTHNRMLYNKIDIQEIKEECEIYNTN